MVAATGPGAAENDDITEAWFKFETKVRRGRGLLRLRDGKCWGLGSNTRKDPGPWEGELRNM